MTIASASSAASQMPGSGAMSPSMLKTPSVMTRIVRSASAARTSRSALRSPSTSRCGKILRSALDSRTPSMMLAWLSSSLTIVAPSGARIGITPVLAVKPDWKVSTASTCLNVGQARLELLVEAHRAGDRAHRAGARAEPLDRVERCLPSFGWVFRPR